MHLGGPVSPGRAWKAGAPPASTAPCSTISVWHTTTLVQKSSAARPSDALPSPPCAVHPAGRLTLHAKPIAPPGLVLPAPLLTCAAGSKT